MAITLERPAYYDARRVNQWCCLSTDSFPVASTQGYKLYQGDEMYVIDTAKTYVYSAATDTWALKPTGGGGADPRVDGILDGSLPPKLAVNLTTSDTVDTNNNFVARTTAGDASIANGPAKLVSVSGDNSTPNHVQGSANITKEEVATASITFVDPTTLTENSYTLSYNGTEWQYNGTTISLATYGITLTGTAYSGDSIVITKSEDVYSAVYNRVDRFTTTFTLATFLNKAELDSMAIGDYTLTYDGTAWSMDGTAISLGDYGISISGTAVSGDRIYIHYISVSTYGTIAVATPTQFITTGFNSFNPDDVLDGYTIDINGNITASSGSYVGFAKCIADTNSWIVGHAEAITRVCYNATAPTTTTTGMTILAKNDALSEVGVYSGNPYYNDAYVVANDGYIVFCGSNLDLVCTHPRWSGRANWHEGGNIDYSTYVSYTTDLIGKTMTRNITRVAYTRATLNQLILDNPTWVEGTQYEWDSNYIYYISATPTTVTYAADSQLWSVGTTRDTIAVNVEINSNDYGIEYLVGTTRSAYVSINYEVNLKDQFRHAVRYDGQVLTSSQAEAARTTIGVGLVQYKATLDATAQVNTIYSLGTVASVTTALPNGANIGDIIVINWYNGSTPATVTISGTMIPFTFTPTDYNISEIDAMWNGAAWSLVGNEQAST